MRRLVILGLIAEVLIAGGCSLGLSEPPNLRVVGEGIEIPTVRGSYCWSSAFRGVCADAIPPPELLKEKGGAPTALPAGTRLQFLFDALPKSGSMSVNRWIEGQPQQVALSSDGTLVAPNEPGVYIYDVSARWSEGSAWYAFQFEIK